MPPLPSVETADGVADAVDDIDVVCLGESMVTFVPSRPGRLADVPSFARGIGGAESNVACGLARAGHRARWISRVGTDGFGEHLVREIAATGVDTAYVQRDPHRPTGIYFRTAGERAVGSETVDGSGPADRNGPADGSGPAQSPAPLAEVVYYRAGSAAAAMSPVLIPRERAWSGRVLHLTGITPALSADCRALMRELTARAPGRPLVSFDLNYRVSLWQREDDAEQGPAVLLGLARGCDLVFVGEDEAEAVWGLRGPAAIRAALPEPETLVVKQGSAGATAYARRPDGTDAVTFEPAPRVDVVAPVGAGDAFAAGFLSGTLRGLPVTERLRHGHLMAAAALTVPGDLGTPPSREQADPLVALDATQWGTLRFGPGWTDLPTPAGKWAETAVVEVCDP
ncbi:carbohydrate kinase [Streptomyces violaceusniger]|uniref:Sugar kinase n=2 Tax=Streptomyces violaceusniger group TaxID=2839105 RepID=A0ABD5JDK9_9ACTN|nr:MULTISPECIES: sugar kinase [Streptomyces]MEE4585339.1 sugar kinase [Streptomyces sp. DSM 41602]WTA83715.1 sugar kinase [Streptomyces antimycoticus]KUL50470.1 carbohydrate kinase [Streptomyces violaceusniger]QTI89207.1 sugar kinase [Streptomyces sp. AgN23]WTB05848.1 sugar kinase [Streptomyces antimycoticus]